MNTSEEDPWQAATRLRTSDHGCPALVYINSGMYMDAFSAKAKKHDQLYKQVLNLIDSEWIAAAADTAGIAVDIHRSYVAKVCDTHLPTRSNCVCVQLADYLLKDPKQATDLDWVWSSVGTYAPTGYARYDGRESMILCVFAREDRVDQIHERLQTTPDIPSNPGRLLDR